MPRSQTPKPPFRFVVYLIVLVIFGLFIRSIFSTTKPSPPPPVTRDWKANTPSTTTTTATPIPTIIANNVSDSLLKEDYWPQWHTWEKDGWVIGPSDPEQTFLRNLQLYKKQGHDLDGITALIDQQSTIYALVDVILRVTDIKKIQPQLEAIVAQTIKPNAVWLMVSSSSTISISTITHFFETHQINTHALYIPQQQNNDDNQQEDGFPWMDTNHISTEWFWVLEQENLPKSPHYLEIMLRLMHSPPYQNALLGTRGILLPSNFHDTEDDDKVICISSTTHLPSVSQPVDMVQGSWLLKKEWMPWMKKAGSEEMQLPLGYEISYQLMKHGDIMTINLPSHPHLDFLDNSNNGCQHIQDAYTYNPGWQHIRSLRTNPTALDYRQATIRKQTYQLDTLLFVLDGPEQAVAYYPLMCRFGYTVHAIVSGADRGLSGSVLKTTLEKTGCHRRVIVHDLSNRISAAGDEETWAMDMASVVARLSRVFRPRATFYIQRDQPLSHALKVMAENENRVAIGLPADDVIHALWISDLPLEALEQWHTPDINLVVITDRRPHSLSRLLQTAERSYYLGDQVNLMVHMEQSSDAVTRMVVGQFPWQHGNKVLRHRIRKGGLMPAIIESWYPKHNDDYAVLLEDDISLSPLFYVWAKYSILQYRYTSAQSKEEVDLRKMMYGVSLYSPRNLELHPAGRRPFHPDNVLLNHYPPRIPYVSQVPCSWGAVYFPEHWREFHEYLTIRLMDLNQDQLLNVTVPKSRSERWKKSWKKYFIELVYLRAYVMLYPNFQSFESFSTNHLETGTHVKTNVKRMNAISAFLVPLMQRDTILAQLPNHRLPAYGDLPVLDLWGYLRTHDELDETASRWHTRVSNCQRTTGTFDPQDLLCPFPPPEVPVPETPKKPKKVKTAYAVEPLEYVTMYYNNQQQQQTQQADEEDVPQPINVAIMPSEPDNGSYLWDDHWLDVLGELDYMNELYNRIQGHPEDLRDILTADAELDLD